MHRYAFAAEIVHFRLTFTEAIIRCEDCVFIHNHRKRKCDFGGNSRNFGYKQGKCRKGVE